MSGDPQKTGLGTKFLNLTFLIISEEQLIVITILLCIWPHISSAKLLIYTLGTF